MSVPVVDLARVIAERLEALGFNIGYDDDCESIFEALEQVDFIKIEDMKKLYDEILSISRELKEL